MVKLFIGSKVLCVFCFEICTPQGRGEKREGKQIVQNKAHRTKNPRNTLSSVLYSEYVLNKVAYFTLNLDIANFEYF